MQHTISTRNKDKTLKRFLAQGMHWVFNRTEICSLFKSLIAGYNRFVQGFTREIHAFMDFQVFLVLYYLATVTKASF